MLSTLTPEGIQTIENNRNRILEVKRDAAKLRATLKVQ
jgi:uncharacterized protein with GYD domain